MMHKLYIRKSKANWRVIYVIASPYLPESGALFAIMARGVEDVEEISRL